MTSPPRALIIDQRTSFPISICRALARRGYRVDVFAESGAGSLRSRSVHRALPSPPCTAAPAFLTRLDAAVEGGGYEAIYLCSEPILYLLAQRTRTAPWRALPLPSPAAIAVFLSKHTIIRRVAEGGAPIPRTRVPESPQEVEAAARVLGLPLLVKGERGHASRHVRLCRRVAEVLEHHRAIAERERAYGGRPALQEYIAGPKYTVGGLFRDGTALRLVGYRALSTYPPGIGETVKLVTEAPAGLIDTARAAFEALGHTGLGSAEFLLDARDGRFKFIDFAPRVWGAVGVAEHAGVELFEPYHALARGEPVAPDLRYAVGVVYRRITGTLRRLAVRPVDLIGFVRDSLDRRVRSDFEWRDPWPHRPSLSWLRG